MHSVNSSAVYDFYATPDCKSYLRSMNWEPGWVEEQRAPIFLTGVPRDSSFSRGVMNLCDATPVDVMSHWLTHGFFSWGSMPPINVLNLRPNRRSTNSPLDIAFIGA